MNPAINNLTDENKFHLLQRVYYTDMRSFVLRHVASKSLLIKAYSIFQAMSLIVPFSLLGYEIVNISLGKSSFEGLVWILAGGAFSFTFLVIIHELIHMLAFRILGRTHLKIGGVLRKFMFYVEADKHVLNKREYLFIAILPFVIILTLGVLGTILTLSSNVMFFIATVTATHSLFCAGDIAIISYMYQNEKERYTYDDAGSKTTYFYEEK